MKQNSIGRDMMVDREQLIELELDYWSDVNASSPLGSGAALLLRSQHGLQAQQALLCCGALQWIQGSALCHQVGGLLGALVWDDGGAQVAPYRPLAWAGRVNVGGRQGSGWSGG
jgi:hypothetical protein